MRGITRDDLLHGNIVKGLLHLSIPLMFLNLINTFYSIVDTYFVGQIGELQVGAVSLISPIMGCGTAFATGLCAAGIAMISRSIGERNYEKADNIATHLVTLCMILGVLIGIFCIVFAKPILNWLDTPQDIYQDAYYYLLGISLDFLFLFLLSIFQCIRQSNGDSKTGVKLNTLSAILNVILDPLFIFTFDLGIFGAALATTVSKALVSPLAIYILLHDKDYTSISFKKHKFSFSTMISIVKVAIPASLGQYLSSFGFVMMSKNIVAYGSIAMSAYGIGNRISSLFYIPVNGIGSALSTFIGQSLGADQPDRAKECFKKAMILMSEIAVVCTIVGLLSSKMCVQLFVKNASNQLLDMALEYNYYAVGTAFFMGWYQIICAIFEGSGNTSITMILSTFRLWGCRIPMIWAFGQFTSLGPTGIWLSMVLSNFVVCSTGQILYFIFPWTRKIVH